MDDWKYHEARRRVNKVKGFYKHLSSWFIFSVVFIFLNLFSGGNGWRSIFPMFPIIAWGIAVMFHAIRVFGIPGLGKDWEERLIERELDRIERDEQINEWREDNTAAHSPSSHHYTEEDPPLQLKRLHKDVRDSDFV